ncbi:OPA3-like protein, partial [Grifola frondosa]
SSHSGILLATPFSLYHCVADPSCAWPFSLPSSLSCYSQRRRSDLTEYYQHGFSKDCHSFHPTKPISNQIKTQAKQSASLLVFMLNHVLTHAQGTRGSASSRMYKTEVNLRTNLLGEPAKHVRPLSETKAIENGANALAEGFLFGVATLLIIGETWRSSRSQSKRRDSVNDQLEDLQAKVSSLTQSVETLTKDYDGRWSEERQRNDELARILERVVEIGLRGGWAEFEDTPMPLPRIQLVPSRPPSQESPAPPSDTLPPGTQPSLETGRSSS